MAGKETLRWRLKQGNMNTDQIFFKCDSCAQEKLQGGNNDFRKKEKNAETVFFFLKKDTIYAVVSVKHVNPVEIILKDALVLNDHNKFKW